jgi:hypothetical protein
VTSCFLRFFVRTLHDYRKFKWNHSFILDKLKYLTTEKIPFQNTNSYLSWKPIFKKS